MHNTKHVIFSLGNEEYGLDVMDVITIEQNMRVEPASNAPANVKGIIHLRGESIPVYSLRKKFGLEDKEVDENTKLIITNSNGITMAYEVDKMDRLEELDSNHVFERPAIFQAESTNYIKNVIRLNNRLVIVLDKESILSDKEQVDLKELMQE